MATIIRLLLDGYHYLNVELADPRTNNWFLMSSPWPMFGIIGCYLFFVYKLGPRIIANREPMKLYRIMQVYDVIQVVLSSYLFYKASILGWLTDYNYSCQPVDYSDTPKAVEIAATCYLYFIVKIIDLLDTVFFVLRKKNNQISFLHVYHHAGMVFGSWCCTKFVAGGHGTFVGLINSFVHAVMYTHYLVTSMKIAKPWWKKYITQMQLLQFFLILYHFLKLFWNDCDYPLWPVIIFIPQNLFMIILFGEFYYKTYIKKPTKKANANNQASQDTSNGKPKSL